MIVHRRQQVAQLRVRGATQREIVDALDRATIWNHDRGEPWGLSTINRDLQLLEAEWRENAAQAIADHRARLLAEIREVRRVAWSKGDLDLVLKGIKQEADLLGVAVPPTLNLNHDSPASGRIRIVNIIRPAPGSEQGSPETMVEQVSRNS